MSDLTADYVIVGGGTAGLIVAHRLKQDLPTARITIIEAGGDNSTYPDSQIFAGMFPLMLSQYNYLFQANHGLHEQNIMAMGAAGKAVGGSATINAGVWYRGPAADYDTWAEIVGDPAWRYDNLIPFFKCAENLQDSEVKNDEQHSNDGYLKVWSAKAQLSDVQWPSRESQKAAWAEAGIDYVPDPNDGNPNGLGEQITVWDKGQRQFASKFLDLKGVQVISGIAVENIVFDHSGTDNPKARSVKLADGRNVTANNEIIVSAGTYNSAKLLMLSGIGDKTALAKHGIESIHDNPNVGANLIEHLSYTTVFKLKEPGALGAPSLSSPLYASGFPADYTYHGQVSKVASAHKNGATPEEQAYLSRPNSSNVQICMWYMPLAEPSTGVPVPETPDGTIASAVTCVVSPTSRGSVTLRSSDPKDPPIINQNFYNTAADRFVMREGLKLTSHVFLDTPSGQSFVEKQLVPEGYQPITAESKDEDIDARVRRFGWSIQHPMGTCALGKVVDSRCRVLGVEGLRVVDASVFPTALGCNTQCAVYAVAERVGSWITGGE